MWTRLEREAEVEGEGGDGGEDAENSGAGTSDAGSG